MSKAVPPIARDLRGRLIVSCQAPDGDAFRDPDSMARFARAAVEGGAAGIRANGVEHVRAIRQAVGVPIIGISKVMQDDGRVLITPTFEAARELVEAGADLIALDCTVRGQRFGAVERLQRIRRDLNVPVLADIATLEEALAAERAGADMILTTMRGYTPETEHVRGFEPEFVRRLVESVSVPVIAEGRIDTPGQARAALDAGAFAVVVGTAITRPPVLTERFVRALDGAAGGASGARVAAIEPGGGTSGAGDAYVAAIDLGGTNTKSGIVSSAGELLCPASVATPVGGRAVLLDHLKAVATSCVERGRQSGIAVPALGVATAGWVNPYSGDVVYATDNLPGWTGTKIAEEVGAAVGLPVWVENDANALAVAEKYFGAGKEADNFVCITLGTGVGGGCYVNGRLSRGANFFANALGHISVQPDGLPCNCGQRGCLEVYANAAALLRYVGEGNCESAEQVIDAANAGHAGGVAAIRTYSGYLATGCAILVQLLDPEVIIISGGLAQDNPLLLRFLEENLRERVSVWDKRGLRLRGSVLGYYGGVFGAAALALQLGRP